LGGDSEGDFKDATVLPSTNNIFVNSSLSEMTWNTIVGSIINAYTLLPVPTFNGSALPLRENNSVVLTESYYCQQRKLKGWLNLFLTVIAADYALIVGGYTLVVLIGSWIEKRRAEGNQTHLTVQGIIARDVMN
jgi:hypothetical protein